MACGQAHCGVEHHILDKIMATYHVISSGKMVTMLTFMDAAATASCTPDLEVLRPVLSQPGAQLQCGEGLQGLAAAPCQSTLMAAAPGWPGAPFASWAGLLMDTRLKYSRSSTRS